MKAAYTAAVSLLTAISCGSQLLGNKNSALMARQGQASYFPITGTTGGVYSRLEIRELEKTGGEM
jgi:tyrosinase